MNQFPDPKLLAAPVLKQRRLRPTKLPSIDPNRRAGESHLRRLLWRFGVTQPQR
jgi:hypothetical protein